MNKYKRLISNTLIFAIGTFSSKVLSFLLTPLLSYALSPAEFSITNMIVDMGNLLLPVVTLGIINSIIRFGLDKSIKKSDVFSTGFLTILFGFLLLLVLQPVIVPVLTPVMEVMEINPAYVSKYMLYLVCFVGMSSMRSLFSQFTPRPWDGAPVCSGWNLEHLHNGFVFLSVCYGVSDGGCGLYFRHHHLGRMFCGISRADHGQPALSAPDARGPCRSGGDAEILHPNGTEHNFLVDHQYFQPVFDCGHDESD